MTCQIRHGWSDLNVTVIIRDKHTEEGCKKQTTLKEKKTKNTHTIKINVVELKDYILGASILLILLIELQRVTVAKVDKCIDSIQG